MASWKDIKLSANLLSESLDNLNLDKSRWLLELIMKKDEDELYAKIYHRREDVGGLLNWPRPGRRKIPVELVSLFVVETLGLDLLSSCIIKLA